jgi:archaemetzincin
MPEIRLVAIGRIDPAIISWLATALTDSLKLPCGIEDRAIDPRRAYNPSRKQHHSTQLIAELLKSVRSAEGRILGVADVDLFIPILTFVFGEAQLGNRAAVVSVHRLRQQFYGLPEANALFYERAEKEALHELGHTFGLVHCRTFDCIMHFSNSIEEIDLKTNAFCPACLDYLRKASSASEGRV